MENLLSLFFGGLLINNVIISRGIGYSTLFSKENRKFILPYTIASILVLAFANGLSAFIIQNLIPTFSYFNVLINLVLVLVFSLIGEAIVSKISSLENWSGVFAYQTINAALFYVLLSSNAQNLDIINSFIYAIGAGLGVGLVLLIVTSFNDRLRTAPAPKAFSHQVLLLVSFGLLALAFSGLAGIF